MSGSVGPTRQSPTRVVVRRRVAHTSGAGPRAPSPGRSRPALPARRLGAALLTAGALCAVGQLAFAETPRLSAADVTALEEISRSATLERFPGAALLQAGVDAHEDGARAVVAAQVPSGGSSTALTVDVTLDHVDGSWSATAVDPVTP